MKKNIATFCRCCSNVHNFAGCFYRIFILPPRPHFLTKLILSFSQIHIFRLESDYLEVLYLHQKSYLEVLYLHQKSYLEVLYLRQKSYLEVLYLRQKSYLEVLYLWQKIIWRYCSSSISVSTHTHRCNQL